MPDEDYTESVLRVVESIPPGKVLNYGAIAVIVGRGGPRQVGAVMTNVGGGVPWWRVVYADGSLPGCHRPDALDHYREEQTPMRAGESVVDIRQAFWKDA